MQKKLVAFECPYDQTRALVEETWQVLGLPWMQCPVCGDRFVSMERGRELPIDWRWMLGNRRSQEAPRVRRNGTVRRRLSGNRQWRRVAVW